MPTEPEPEKKPSRRQSTKPPKDAKSVFAGQKIETKTETRSIPFETHEELGSRLRREEADAAHERQKETVVYRVFAGLLCLTTAACLFVVVVPFLTYPPETLKLASTRLTAIVSGGASYFAGKAAGKGNP